MLSEKYDPRQLEGKWQQVWEETKVFEAPDPAKDPKKRPKYYCLCMFPYPSGAIHMGHIRNYSIGDIISRFKRMKGFNVLQPIGWDAFGLPAENAANQRGVHPRDWTLQNIAQMKSELKSMGISYDWSREITTCLPEYFKWEQVLFQRFYKEGLAYKKKGQVNWCEKCQTVLANEQVHEGLCWRCDGPVVQKELSQWYLKITKYADELLSGHEILKNKWPDRVLDMQKHWIGKSEGARIFFPLEKKEGHIEVFTTRADTLFGVRFVTIAPGHALAFELCGNDKAKISQLEKMKNEVANRPKDEQPTSKEGFFTGSHVTHPLSGEKIPVWVGDFVLLEYGSGAVMGVPAHDQRDFEFAKAHGLPLKRVINPVSGSSEPVEAMKEAFVDAGVLVDSGAYSGKPSEEATRLIAKELEKKKLGGPTNQYRFRDWGISRQRYWGAPVPVINCTKCGIVLVPEKELPLELPYDVKFGGTGNPLAAHPTWKETSCPQCKSPAQRETDTMDTFVESSWYYARFTSSRYDKGPFEKQAADGWLPVDAYIGGIEHACMHLLYARFFHRVLRDWGYLSQDEPFLYQLSQGMVIKDGAKMSKSKGNVVTPSSIIDRYGADTARLFSLFAAPYEKDLDWNEKGVEGCHRFLHRVWRLFYTFRDQMASTPAAMTEVPEPLMVIRRKTHWMIQKMTDDIENQKFNTAISAGMELVNEVFAMMEKDAKAFQSAVGGAVIHEAISNLVVCLAPFSPHMAEELWREMGHETLIASEAWPAFDARLLKEDSFVLVVQVNGKVRDRVSFPKNSSKSEIEKQVLALAKLKPYLEGKQVKQFVYVPERIANVVVV